MVSGMSVASSARVRMGTVMAYLVAVSMNIAICRWCIWEGGCTGPIVSLLMASAGCRWSCVVRRCGRCVPFPYVHELHISGMVVSTEVGMRPGIRRRRAMSARRMSGVWLRVRCHTMVRARRLDVSAVVGDVLSMVSVTVRALVGRFGVSALCVRGAIVGCTAREAVCVYGWPGGWGD